MKKGTGCNGEIWKDVARRVYIVDTQSDNGKTKSRNGDPTSNRLLDSKSQIIETVGKTGVMLE